MLRMQFCNLVVFACKYGTLTILHGDLTDSFSLDKMWNCYTRVCCSTLSEKMVEPWYRSVPPNGTEMLLRVHICTYYLQLGYIWQTLEGTSPSDKQFNNSMLQISLFFLTVYKSSLWHQPRPQNRSTAPKTRHRSHGWTRPRPKLSWQHYPKQTSAWN